VARTLTYLGLVLLAVSAWLLLADESGWVGGGESEALVPVAVKVGIGFIATGLLFGVLDPLWRRVSRNRCVRCGRAVERGQTYCNDHLRATLNEYQDQARRRGVL